jgi:hypothetical protein
MQRAVNLPALGFADDVKTKTCGDRVVGATLGFCENAQELHQDQGQHRQ